MKVCQIILAMTLTLSYTTSAFCFEFFDNINKASELGTELESLKAEVGILKEQLVTLNQEYKQIKFQLDKIIGEQIKFNTAQIIELRQAVPLSGTLEPSNKGYIVLNGPSLKLAISCQNIKKYSTGAEITLQVVNMLATDTTGIKLTIDYSSEKIDYSDIESYEKYEKNKKQTIESIDLAPSRTATLVTVRIPEYTPEQIKILEISATAEAISFIKNKRQ